MHWAVVLANADIPSAYPRITLGKRSRLLLSQQVPATRKAPGTVSSAAFGRDPAKSAGNSNGIFSHNECEVEAAGWPCADGASISLHRVYTPGGPKHGIVFYYPSHEPAPTDEAVRLFEGIWADVVANMNGENGINLSDAIHKVGTAYREGHAAQLRGGFLCVVDEDLQVGIDAFEGDLQISSAMFSEPYWIILRIAVLGPFGA